MKPPPVVGPADLVSSSGLHGSRADAQQFRMGEREFISAFENVLIGMVVVSLDYRRLAVNQAICDFLGYSKEELLSMAVSDIVYPDDWQVDLVHLAALASGEKTSYRLEKRYVHRSGRVLWGDYSCRLVRDVENRPLHFISQVQDITERKNAEQALRERTEELRQAQAELVSTARRAGMAEIATNVLHNVGNILNSVNVSANLMASTLQNSRLQGLDRAVRLLDQHHGDLAGFLTSDDRGRMLPGYLHELAQALADERSDIADELARLNTSIDHIKRVVATQQSYAGTATVLEPVRICELIDDALRINGNALASRQVIVHKDYAQVPELLLDKTRIMEILVNLISNAKNAMDTVTDRPHRMILTVASSPEVLRVSVQDEGEGIAPENIERIFAHGFTTRKQGHGFGLHSCALAARQMGGTLSAQSEGPGRGAVFTLELPARPVQPPP